MTSEPSRPTRRGFVVGAAAVAASSAAALTLDGCGSNTSQSQELVDSVKEQFPSAEVEYLAVDFSQVQPHTDMNNVESADYLSETNSFNLPLGSLLYQSSDTQALVLGPGASSKALIRLGLVNLDNGEFTSALEQALGAGEDYIIYDARASSSVIAWVECNMVHGLWRVYAVPFADGVLNEELMKQAQLLDEGEGTYSPPQLAVGGTKAYWTVMPDPTGPASSEDSYLKVAEFDSSKSGATADIRTVYTSHGRMITNPVISGDVITFVPRVDTDTVYYQLTTMEMSSDTVLNISILPPSLRVSDAAWLEKGFAFCIEGNYTYAEGLSLFGTYQQLGDGRYLYVNKAPSSAPVQVKSCTYVKSTKNVLGIDAEQGIVAIVDTPQDCVSHGDILVGAGKQNRLVLYTTVTARLGQEAGTCHVRVFDAVQ